MGANVSRLFIPDEQWRRNRLAINIVAALVGALTHLNIRATFFFNAALFLVLLVYAYRSTGAAAAAAAPVE